MHPSALPLFRGPSPIITTLLEGCSHSGISIMRINENLDEGDIYAQMCIRDRITAARNSPGIFKGRTIMVDNTSEMKEMVLKNFDDSDIIIMTAAVSDVIPQKRFEHKLKKKDELFENLRFIENENILEIISERKKKNQTIVGFAAESSQDIANAMEKINKKNIDFIILNDISRDDIGFESDYNEIVIIDRDGIIKKVPKAKKRLIAREIINHILE